MPSYATFLYMFIYCSNGDRMYLKVVVYIFCNSCVCLPQSIIHFVPLSFLQFPSPVPWHDVRPFTFTSWPKSLNGRIIDLAIEVRVSQLTTHQKANITTPYFVFCQHPGGYLRCEGRCSAQHIRVLCFHSISSSLYVIFLVYTHHSQWLILMFLAVQIVLTFKMLLVVDLTASKAGLYVAHDHEIAEFKEVPSYQNLYFKYISTIVM